MKAGGGISALVCLVWLFVAISHLGAATSPAEAKPDSTAARGQTIFRKSCLACHSVHPGETKVGPSLAGICREGGGLSEPVVRQIIREGKGDMPGFKERLGEPDIDELVAYLKTL